MQFSFVIKGNEFITSINWILNKITHDNENLFPLTDEKLSIGSLAFQVESSDIMPIAKILNNILH